jgi:hypothetical protein
LSQENKRYLQFYQPSALQALRRVLEPHCGAGFILLAGFSLPLAIELPIPKSADESARSLNAAPQLHWLLLRAS